MFVFNSLWFDVARAHLLPQNRTVVLAIVDRVAKNFAYFYLQRKDLPPFTVHVPSTCALDCMQMRQSLRIRFMEWSFVAGSHVCLCFHRGNGILIRSLMLMPPSFICVNSISAVNHQTHILSRFSNQNGIEYFRPCVMNIIRLFRSHRLCIRSTNLNGPTRKKAGGFLCVLCASCEL